MKPQVWAPPRVRDRLGSEAQPRGIGSQVVGNAADQRHTGFEQAAEAAREAVEGGNQSTDLGRATRANGDAGGLCPPGHPVDPAAPSPPWSMPPPSPARPETRA